MQVLTSPRLRASQPRCVSPFDGEPAGLLNSGDHNAHADFAAASSVLNRPTPGSHCLSPALDPLDPALFARGPSDSPQTPRLRSPQAYSIFAPSPQQAFVLDEAAEAVESRSGINTRGPTPLIQEAEAPAAAAKLAEIAVPPQPTASVEIIPGLTRRQSFEDRYVAREAKVADAECIVELTQQLDMTNATSFVWPLQELRRRIEQRNPMIVIAVERTNTDDVDGIEKAPSGASIDARFAADDAAVAAAASRDADCPDGAAVCASQDGAHEVNVPLAVQPVAGARRASRVVGVAGIDVCGMEKSFPVWNYRTGLTADVPSNCCMCRGLLVHPDHQGYGVGSTLHKARIALLASLYPNTPSVVLSARGNTFEESLSKIGSALPRPANSPVPKDVVLSFTFRTSYGIVHMAHSKEREGWDFLGLDVADGGAVWLTSKPLAEVASPYMHLARSVALRPSMSKYG